MATYNVVAVQRTPQSGTVPTLQELGPLEASFDYTDILNEAPEGNFRLDVDSLQDDIKTSLLDPVAQPLEVWVYRESVKVFAGPLVGHEIKDDLLTIAARGAEFYTAYMLVETDKTWAAVLSGSAEFGVADPTFVAISAERGQNGVVVASLVNGVPCWGITVRDDIPTLRDATSRRVSASKASDTSDSR